MGAINVSYATGSQGLRFQVELAAGFMEGFTCQVMYKDLHLTNGGSQSPSQRDSTNAVTM